MSYSNENKVIPSSTNEQITKLFEGRETIAIFLKFTKKFSKTVSLFFFHFSRFNFSHLMALIVLLIFLKLKNMLQNIIKRFKKLFILKTDLLPASLLEPLDPPPPPPSPHTYPNQTIRVFNFT